MGDVYSNKRQMGSSLLTVGKYVKKVQFKWKSSHTCSLALFGEFKKWSKILASVLKTCVYDVKSSKKNLGSIGGSLEEPQPKHVHWCLAQRFAHYMSFARQFADLKNFTRYV